MSDHGNLPPTPPFYGAVGAQGPPPPNYLVWAVLSTVLCCLPLGVASIVFSSQVNSKWAIGDVAGSQAASANARNFAIWSVVASAISAILALVLFAVLGLTLWSTSTIIDSVPPQ